VHVHVHVHVHVSVYVCMHVQERVQDSISVTVCECMRIRPFVSMRLFVCMGMCMWACVDARRGSKIQRAVSLAYVYASVTTRGHMRSCMRMRVTSRAMMPVLLLAMLRVGAVYLLCVCVV
jgi:hypothetical protein